MRNCLRRGTVCQKYITLTCKQVANDGNENHCLSLAMLQVGVMQPLPIQSGTDGVLLQVRLR